MRRITTTLFSVLFLLSVLTFSVSAQDVPEAYKSLIDQYINGLSRVTDYDYNNLGDFGGGVFIDPTGVIPDEFGFSLYDMNGDGTQELFVGSNYPEMPGYWAAIYTIDNGQPKQLALHEGSDNSLLLLGDLSSIGHPEWSNTIYQLAYMDGVGNFSYSFSKLEGTNLVEVGQSGEYLADHAYCPQPFISFNQYRSSAPAPTPITVEEGPAGTIYRLYNSQTGEHLYSPDHNEAQTLANSGWNYEGFGWTAPTEGEAVYRLFNPSINDHLYTTDTNEVNVLTSSGWQADNNGQPLFYSGGDRPIYRLYQDSTGRHHLTTDENEYNTLPGSGWTQEGVKLHGIG